MRLRHHLHFFLVVCGLLLVGLTGAGQVKDYKPVTNAMLLNPDPADWLHFRRTLDEQGYSPLNQINRQNVHQLQLERRSESIRSARLWLFGVLWLTAIAGIPYVLDQTMR